MNNYAQEPSNSEPLLPGTYTIDNMIKKYNNIPEFCEFVKEFSKVTLVN